MSRFQHEDWLKYNLLSCCVHLHSSVCGSGDRASPEQEEEWAEFLRWRVTSEWTKSRSLYEATVRNLCAAAVAAYDIEKRGPRCADYPCDVVDYGQLPCVICDKLKPPTKGDHKEEKP